MNKKRLSNESGFMGTAHALSATAVFLVLTVVAPNFIFNKVLGTTDKLILFSALVVIAGWAFAPDFDNTRSTVISKFGIFGRFISKSLRAIAVVIYDLTRSKYDDPQANPHRLFWHTGLSAILIGLIVFFTTKIPTLFYIKELNKEYTIGFMFMIFYIFISTYLGISFFLGYFIKKKQGFITQMFIILTCFFYSISLILYSNGTIDHSKWIASTAFLGYVLHILGDCTTKLGAPLLFPFKIKGKRWYMVRFAKLTAGGTIEKFILIPFFLLLNVICLAKILAG